MLLTAKLTIDPSEVTKIVKVKPTKVFGKILYRMTLGVISAKEEQETFGALSILQSINRALMNCGVNNIIRLAHDDKDFYLDLEGKKDDLKLAMDKYAENMDQPMDCFYKNLLLICEHEDNEFKYLIEISINKNHSVGDYPIEISISGAMKQFKVNLEENAT